MVLLSTASMIIVKQQAERKNLVRNPFAAKVSVDVSMSPKTTIPMMGIASAINRTMADFSLLVVTL